MFFNTIESISYGKTLVRVTRPWSLYRKQGSRVLCADGKIRSLAYLADTADTFFSVPAAIRVQQKYVSGYVTVEENESGQRVFAFRSHTKHHFPKWPDRFTPEHAALVAKAY
jgi:hypothetical protein